MAPAGTELSGHVMATAVAERLGSPIVSLDAWRLLALKWLQPRGATQNAEAYQGVLDEIKFSCLRYVLAMAKALYGPEATWTAQRSRLLRFARGGLPDLLRTYAACVRRAFANSDEPVSECCASAGRSLPDAAAVTVPATCAHALEFLWEQIKELLAGLHAAKRRKVVELATSSKACEHYVAVVRALIELHLDDK